MNFRSLFSSSFEAPRFAARLSMQSRRCVLVAGLLLGVLPGFGSAAGAQRMASPDQVPEGLTGADWRSIHAAHEEGQHAFRATEGGWVAENPGQSWTTRFDERGFVATPQRGEWSWGLELRGYGFAGMPAAVDAAAAKAEGTRLAYQRSAVLEEWFVNSREGVEHGFTVTERPAGGVDPAALLQFDLAVRGSLRPSVEADRRDVRFSDASGVTVLHYAGLKVWDAEGKILDSHFELAGELLRLVVDERGARYPLTIDPQAYLKASNTGNGDLFSYSVAVSGDTVVVGAYDEDSNATGVNGNQADNSASSAGAVYVFVRNGVSWTQQAYLKASNTEAGDGFGCSVAISGDTVVVGASAEASNATGVDRDQTDNSEGTSGAAYVFVRNGMSWTQQAYLKASNTEAGDYFGCSVAISGDTVVVGASREASNATGVDRDQTDNSAILAGAAYVFTRSGTTWEPQAYLKASNSEDYDQFGGSVAVSGDTVVVGAAGEGSSATGVDGNQADNSAFRAGAAYVFTRSGPTWTQRAYLKASNTGGGDYFGTSVAVSGDTVVVAASGEASNATGVDGNQADNSASMAGAAYVFTRSGTTWAQQAYLKASNTGASDYFSTSVAISGDTVVVGAVAEDGSATGVNGNQADNSVSSAGAAYVFTRSGGIWMQQAYLKASNPGAGDQCGSSVAISGDTVVVGAVAEDGSATGVNGNQADNSAAWAGAAYVFSREMIVEAPAGSPLTAGVSAIDFGIRLFGEAGVTKVFTIKNDWSLAPLVVSGVQVVGAGAADFSVNTTGMSAAIQLGQQTTFSVTFAPVADVSGGRSATLRLLSDDPVHPTFDIALSGMGLSHKSDTDGDGLADAWEYRMATLGFDWTVAQPELTKTLLANPNAAGLYTVGQVQSLAVVTPQLTRNASTGAFTLTVPLEKSVSLAAGFVPFPLSLGTVTVNAAGDLEFTFSTADNAALFRVESH